MNYWLRNFILLTLMLTATGLAIALRPTQRIADQEPKVILETMIPHAFGDWHEEKQSSAQIIDPQQLETIEKIYSQTLTRTYVNGDGYQIMLSVAYGREQSDALKVHRPEVCYPAQGFLVQDDKVAKLTTDFGTIRVRRLMTSLNNRFEPVTYWITLGDKVVQGNFDTKLAQLAYGVKGEIPDGILFRISSLSQDAQLGYDEQTAFARALIAALPTHERQKLTGL